MFGMIWVVLFVALTGSHLGYGLPVRPTPQTYPHDGQSLLEGWTSQGGLYAAIPVLALVLTALVLLVGCTWCYRHKDCKLFSASASHLHTARVAAPDSGFSEPVNNNISEDNNNGPISLREMQNIANNNAAAYIVSENEERNRISRESVVEFEPLPMPPIVAADPLERCADWFATEDFPRNSLQYLREIGRGWFGRVVEGEIEEAGATSTVAVKILNQNAGPQDKARFLDEARMFRDLSHEQILGYLGKCVTEDPWILIFELCSMNLHQYLVTHRPHMSALNESGTPLQLMCDVTSALAHLHAAGYTYGRLWSGSVMIRSEGESARAVLGRYEVIDPQHDIFAPEIMRRGAAYTCESEIWSLGSLIWEVCSWGAAPSGRPAPPELPCPYKNHLYQVMQLCWHSDPPSRPSAAQVHALILHLHSSHSRVRLTPVLTEPDTDFEDRWQRLKPNTIPKLDEHIAIVHAPSTSELEPNLLTVGVSTTVSRSSSIMSDRDPLSTQIKSESLTNLHGSFEDVRNIYLTHNETPLLECHQGNMLDNERDADCSDASVDPWLKDIIAGSQDDVSYYRDVSDVIKNLDNILNSEKTSSSESSHQASPSRDNLSLDCKKEYPVQSSLVKSPGISNFQSILDTGFASGDQENEPGIDDEVDRDTIGTLSHSFERHSDTTSQQTLENLTPDTPMKDIDIFGKIEVQVDIERLDDDITEPPDDPSQTDIESDLTENIESTYVAYTEPESIENTCSKPIETFESIVEDVTHQTVQNDQDRTEHTELPNQIVDNKVPELKQLCKASVPSVSETEDQLIVRKDCETSCDKEIRTDNEETKSVVDVRELESVAESMPLAETEVTDLVEVPKEIATKITEETILPKVVEDSTASIEGIDTLPSVTDDVSNITQENEASQIKESNTEDIEPESLETEDNYSKDETILVSDLMDTVTDSSKDQPVEPLDVEQAPTTQQIPVSVQTLLDDKEKTAHFNKLEIETILPPEIVQNTSNSTSLSESENLVNKDESVEEDNLVHKDNEEAMLRSDNLNVKEQSDGSTVYMDLINNTNSKILKDNDTSNNANESVNEAKTNDNINNDYPASEIQRDASLNKTESTVYLDLPSFEVIKYTDGFLHMERMISSGLLEQTVCASTPITSDNSANNTLENTKDSETLILSDNKIQDASVSKEQKSIQENVSPFESPSKSHHTDTYEENSSVVLGPFENCNLEVKTGKPAPIDLVELPKEELLAFSSNFSEINLETPSPLRDGNFLNEVPDIVSDDVQFDDLASISEPKQEPLSETTDSKSGTEKRISPSTPPNSPGIFLASTSQQKYLVDIDLNNAPEEPEPIPIQDEIDLNQIELQITSKLAMAENENNMNIEYSGPLTVEGLIEEGEITRDSDAIPEMFLAGNVNGMVDARDVISLDEECVQALRNELELKLPLAQVAAIEPQCEGEGEWSSELPPPPELIVSYPGALSPIAEETGQQLSAYENDAQWNASVRTESSSSYPEPCNSQSCTEQPTHEHTYTLPDHDHDQRTYTIVKDIATSSREITMSADSLNCSPRILPKDDPLSPIDDRTYNKDDVVETERISQVSPFLVSPTTDTSVPSDNCDHPTGVSTLSKTTLPTDAKISKPTETQCLSKATSIDSWCSNDTLYNVEENFDDLAMDADVPVDLEPEEGKSESTDTLTHNEDEKEHSNCSTYIIHDSKSEPCETFSPDSITANDNYTYTKAKTEQAVTTPSNHTELNDSTKNTQTKDLAYGTMPTFSNCTTEVMSGFEEAWKIPELVRKSPIGDDVNISPPKAENVNTKEFSSPQFSSEPTINRMESIEISCLKDNLVDSPKSSSETGNVIKIEDSPNYNYRNMTPTLTSTPLVDLVETENIESISMVLPETSDNPTSEVNALYFENYQKSTETKLQNQVPTTEVLLLDNTTNVSAANTTPSYSDFENSALRKPQDLNAADPNSQTDSTTSDGFKHFEESVKNCPQDLSSMIDASSRLLESERLSSVALLSQSLINPPNISYLIESQIEANDLGIEPTSSYLINFGPDDETEQPHSIIVTEVPMTVTKASPNKTYDSHTENNIESNETYDSHIHNNRPESEQPKINGESEHDEIENIVADKIETLPNEVIANVKIEPNDTNENQNLTNGSETEVLSEKEISNKTAETPNEPEIKIVPNEEVIDKRTEKPNESETQNLSNGSHENETPETDTTDKTPKKIANFATVNFLNETFEELIESNVDEADVDKSDETTSSEIQEQIATPINNLLTSTEPVETSNKTENVDAPDVDAKDVNATDVDTKDVDASETTLNSVEQQNGEHHVNEVEDVERITIVTKDFLHNEKNYCQVDSYLPMLSDIRFTGPAAEIMSTSFNGDSPTSPTSPTAPTSPATEPDKPDAATEIMKDWDSDTDSHSSNSSSGEFIWKQRGGGENNTSTNPQEPEERGERDGASSGSAESGSEGSEVEFVPSSWDCRAAPAKSSLRSVDHAQPVDSLSKKRVVFKRQKYHCVYEYPRELNDFDQHSPAYLPDFSTYTEWEPSNAEEAELCYGQLFSSPSALSAGYPLRAGIAFGADYDEDFFISSSARPFESLGIMSTTSQFFPGMHVKPSLLERDIDDGTEDFPPPPSPLPSTTLIQSRTPSLDFTTPDSGVEDITPGSTTDDDFKKKLPESDMPWRMDSGSSSESVSPSSPGGEALGGLRHTRDKLKLDLPPSPHVPSPRHNRVFNFVLDKPKRRQDDQPPTTPSPLVMTDETPVVTNTLPLHSDEEVTIPEPTFSTFGKSGQKVEPEQKIILDEVTQDIELQTEVKDESAKVVEAVKGEGTVLDSGDEDSGIESSSKATLERNKTPNIS